MNCDSCPLAQKGDFEVKTEVLIEEIPQKKKSAIEILKSASGFMAAFLFVVAVAFGLHFLEIKFTETLEQYAPPASEYRIMKENIQNDSVSEYLEKGYLEVVAFLKSGVREVFGVKTAFAATPAYSATQTLKSENIEITAGEKYAVILGFKNTGSKTWTNTGKNFISIYTYSPKYRKSVFWDSGWYAKTQPVILKNDTVKPGEIGYFEFYLKAPEKLGKYTEGFILAAEDKTFLAGSQFNIGINVIKRPKYQASRLLETGKGAGDAVEIALGKKLAYTIAFKNTGTETWYANGKNFVSVYAVNPNYRKSKFADEKWVKNTEPAILKTEIVKPGETGYFEFYLKAPEKLGKYAESFALAVEDKAWIKNGKFNVNIKVVEKPQLMATRLIQSHQKMILKQGEAAEFKIGFKNDGTAKWNERAIVKKDTYTAAGMDATDADLFIDSSWVDTEKATVIDDEIIKPGELSYISFVLKAPYKAGDYKLKFALLVNGEELDGAEFELPATVTDESISGTTEEPIAATLGVEPNMRIGLYYTTENVQVLTNGDYELRDANGNLFSLIAPQVKVILSYNLATKIYSAEYLGNTYTSQSHLRLLPLAPSTFKISNYSNPPKWNKTLNDNVFRGALELQYIADAERLWVINDLALEDYLKGLAETSSSDPLEYQKAQTIAARTYAYFHYMNGGKHPKQTLTLNASSLDQVYKGYNSEARLPKVVEAVEATRGQVITYNGNVVVTPYFAKSDGRTRTWSQAWGGADKPWLISRPCPYDDAKGRTRFGHGVGMSQKDAIDRAKDGYGFQSILDAYYTGIKVTRVY